MKMNHIVEVRVFRGGKVEIGYFNAKKMARACIQKYNGKFSICMTLNPITKQFLEDKELNKMIKRSRAVSDKDIEILGWVMIDIDPKRPSGMSATTEETKEARKVVKEVKEFLLKKGFPEPTLCFSGNGYHLLFEINEENNQDNVQIIKKFLQVLDKKFSNDKAKIDLTTYNPARLTRFYGTINPKGKETQERVHRKSKIIRRGPEEYVALEKLQEVIAMVPAVHKKEAKKSDGEKFNIEEWLEKTKLIQNVVKKGSYGEDAYKWVLSPCPWNSDHTDNGACIIQFDNGAISAGCRHDGCANQNWQTLKTLYPIEQKEVSLSEQLVQMVEEKGIECFTDENSQACAQVELTEFKEVIKIGDTKFKTLLTRDYYLGIGKPPKAETIRQAIAVFEMKAITSGVQRRVDRRIAQIEDCMYYDLNNTKGEVVKISSKGVTIEVDTEAYFYKAKTLMEQVKPDLEAKPKELKKLIKKHFRFKKRQTLYCLQYI